MTGRTLTGAVVAAWMILIVVCPAADDKPAKEAAAKSAAGSPIQYLPLDAPAGMSKAVVVQGAALVHTRQLFPVDRDGKFVGEGSIDKQIEQTLDNLDAVLKSAGSGLSKIVRLNVCAIERPTVERVRELLAKRLDPATRPAITCVLTPLGHRKAQVALDAVAVGAEKGPSVALQRCEGVAGDKECADLAVLPRGGVAYFSGRPDEGGLTESAFTKSMSWLLKTLNTLKLKPADVVQVRVFLRPAAAADDVTREMKKVFPGQMLPPVVYVEWMASMPVEIELIASLPISGKPAETVELYNPPDTSPNNVFSRVALVRTERQIYTSSLFAREKGKGEPQCKDVFEQLKAILQETGSDMVHLAKATYLTSDDDGSRGYDLVRPRLLDSRRPPAASKVMVFGVGPESRSLSLDMIAVGVKP